MTNREKILAAVAVSLVLFSIGSAVWANNAQERAVRAEGRIEGLNTALRDLRVSKDALQDSVETVSVATDEALGAEVAAEEAEVEAEEESEAVLAETAETLDAQSDSLDALELSPEAEAIIAARDSVHAVRLASKDSVIAAQNTSMAAKDVVISAQAEEIRVLTLLDVSNQQIISNLEAQNEQYGIANDALQDAVRSLRLQRKVERGLALGIVGFAAYRAFSGS